MALLLHILDGPLLFVRTEDEVARLHLVQENIFEDAQEAPVLEGLRLFICELVALEGNLSLCSDRRINTKLKVIDPFSVNCGGAAAHSEDTVGALHLQRDSPPLLQELILNLYLLEVYYSLRWLAVVALSLVLVVPQHPM